MAEELVLTTHTAVGSGVIGIHLGLTEGAPVIIIVVYPATSSKGRALTPNPFFEGVFIVHFLVSKTVFRINFIVAPKDPELPVASLLFSGLPLLDQVNQDCQNHQKRYDEGENSLFANH